MLNYKDIYKEDVKREMVVRLAICLAILLVSNIISIVQLSYSYKKNFKAGDTYRATVNDIQEHSERVETSYDEDGDLDTTTYTTYKVDVTIDKTQENRTIYQELNYKFANHVIKPGATVAVTIDSNNKAKIMEPKFLDTVNTCLAVLIIILIASILTIIQPLSNGRFKYLSVVNIWIVTWVIISVTLMLYEMISPGHINVLNNLTVRMIH